jgi:hypothetical protein
MTLMLLPPAIRHETNIQGAFCSETPAASALLLYCHPLLLYAKEYNSASLRAESSGIVLSPHDRHLNYMENNGTLCHNSLFQNSEKQQ